MSKSIYEDAFNHLDELVDALAHIEGSFLYRHYLDNIRLKLKQAQKQEKLLKLYQELDKINGWLLLCFTIGGEETEKEYHQLGGGIRRHELIKQIKELENEVSKRMV